MNVYIAAAIFSPAERAFNEQISDALSSFCEVHLPHRDGPLVERDIGKGAGINVGRMAYESDIFAIRRCDAVIAVLEGRALDEGVCIEMGFAKALKKHIVGFKSDVRWVLPWGNNPMVDGCVDHWVKSIDELVSYMSQFQVDAG